MPRPLLLSALVVLVACRAAAAPTAPAILPPADFLDRHNAWADRLPHLWARADLTLNFPKDETGQKREQHDLGGHLFLAKPDRLFVHGEVLGKDVFTVGMNPERFWLWIRPEVNTVWTGRRGGEGERRFILSPADLMMALGVFRIAIDPAVPAEFVAQAGHYILTERYPSTAAPAAPAAPADPPAAAARVDPSGPPAALSPAASGPRRRVWFDRETLRPVRVDLFDEAGRRLLLAELLRYQPAGPDQTPVCTAYRARFYGDGQEMVLVLRLSGVDLRKEPNPKVFDFRPAPGAKVIDLDAAPPASHECMTPGHERSKRPGQPPRRGACQ